MLYANFRLTLALTLSRVGLFFFLLGFVGVGGGGGGGGGLIFGGLIFGGLRYTYIQYTVEVCQ